MRKSDRLLWTLVGALVVVNLAYVFAMRMSLASEANDSGARTPSAAELAGLRDFSRLRVNGDFSVEIVQSPEYSVSFAPASTRGGNLRVQVRGATLELRGYGNTAESRVRVAMPGIASVYAEDVPQISLSDFGGETVALTVDAVGRITLRNNSVHHWRVSGSGSTPAVLQVDRATPAGSKLDVSGRITFTPID